MSKRNIDNYDDLTYHTSSLSKEEKNKLSKEALFGYHNDDNPFNDDELDKPFQWTKKDTNDFEYNDTKDSLLAKRLKNADKIREVKERRNQYEQEKRDRELLREEQKRLEEQEKMEDLLTQQEEFNKKQAFINSRVRIQGNTPKPVDVLIKNLILIPSINIPLGDFDNSMLPIGLPPETQSPKNVLELLSDDEKIQVISDLELLRQYELLQPYDDYFDVLIKFINMTLNQKSDNVIDKDMQAEIDEIYVGKDYNELLELSTTIKQQLEEGEGMDTDYWSSVYIRITEHMYDVLLIQKNKEFIEKRDSSLFNNEVQKSVTVVPVKSLIPEYPVISLDDAVDDLYSPPPLDMTTLARSFPIITDTKDKENLLLERKKVLEAQTEDIIASILLSRKKGISRATGNEYDEDSLYNSEMSKGMEEDESQMKDEISLPHSSYLWENKYKPRKPKYFNRVKSGFEWNQYNQTHYDKENPPPKVVQGYRFNIFYPDLINKSHIPKYVLEPLEDNDYCIIRFHSGPPYEDIAFKIVNREWDKNPRHGFKYLYERGILHLHFDFKRYRYKR